LAFTHAQSSLRHLSISSDEALLFERLASRVLFADSSLRAGPDTITSNELGQAGLWPHGISGDLPILLVRVVGDEDVLLVRQVLQAQEYWRLKGLKADVVIVNEDPSSYLDEMHARLTAVMDNGPWRTWKHRSGGAYLLREDLIGKVERTLIEGRRASGPSAGTVATSVLNSRSRIRSRSAGVRRLRPLPRRRRPSRRSSTRRLHRRP
jgi:cyclic beta-1,2-glucan synthetase